jgi:hypothetical protein
MGTSVEDSREVHGGQQKIFGRAVSQDKTVVSASGDYP